MFTTAEDFTTEFSDANTKASRLLSKLGRCTDTIAGCWTCTQDSEVSFPAKAVLWISCSNSYTSVTELCNLVLL